MGLNIIIPPENEIRRVVAYDTLTSTAIVSPPFSTAPLPNREVEILGFSYDNHNPFSYSGSVVSQQEMVCYELELLNLNITK